MSPKTRLSLITLALTTVALVSLAAPDVESDAAAGPGKVDWKSAGQLAFGPDDVLFLADSLGAAVYAVDLRDQDENDGVEDLRIEDVDAKVAALLGTTPQDVLIHDMAVHPTTRNLYLSVSRGRGDDAQPVLVKVRPSGELSALTLDEVRFSKAPISNAPAAEAKSRRGEPLRTLTITDMAYADGYLFVAGLSNEEFASNLRKIPYPFSGEMTASSIEIFHGAHGQYETHAPIRTLLPYHLEGKPYVLAAYTCTPLVTIPVEQLKDGEHVKGKTVAELGYGNRPLDMIAIERGGKSYILVANSSRGGMRLEVTDVAKATPITVPVDSVTAGAGFVPMPLGGVLRFDRFGDDAIVTLRRDVESGSVSISAMPLRWIVR